MFPALIEKLTRREDLTSDEAAAAMAEVMEGRARRRADRRPADRPGDERRAAGRDRRPGADDARARGAAVAAATTTCSTPAARAAIGRARSISRRARRWSSPPAACASRSTATDRCRACRAAPTSSRRSASASTAPPAVVERCLAEARHRVLLRADVSSVDAACRAGAARARRADRVQPARAADQPGRARRGSWSACRGRSSPS